MNLQIKFANPQQREAFYSTARNGCFSGGFNNGKSFIYCLKAFTLLSTFPRYRYFIARQTYADLKKTTMETFFKICPGEFIERHNEQDGLTILKNGSRIDWLHLDKVEESTLRGLEINSGFVDQAEEIEEKTYDILDARIGRWDNAVIPTTLFLERPNWPRNELTGKWIAPSYLDLACNPDTQYHFIYRKYHPESIERDPDFFFVEGEWDQSLGSQESYKNALKHDQEWIDKYVKGKWGISNAQIHRVWPESYLEWSEELWDRIQRKGQLYRVLDHGESSPTCCLWAAALDGIYIFYREYYVPNQVISYHRREIARLSGEEKYSSNYSDPQMFKKTSQKDGGFWTTADEYLTADLDAPPIAFIPADNNEYATRNRINELLKPQDRFKHPVTGISPSPGIYFIRRSDAHPNGCNHVTVELPSQRRKLEGYIDGKAFYSDERQDGVADHSYDCVRYFIAMHGSFKSISVRRPPPMSIAMYKLMDARRKRLMANMPLSSR